MPCTNCMAEYSKVRKEHGCSKCAFGFCAKCVTKKFVIPFLSPKPVSVCDNCFDILSGKIVAPEVVKRQKSRTAAQDGEKASSSSANWWGEDKLPPPSMRAQYAEEKRKAAAAAAKDQHKGNDDWYSLERRLADLVKDQPDANVAPQSVATVAADGEKRGGVTLSELEERLAALKGVPVEIVRKPRLLIASVDDEDEDDVGGAFADDAQKLLAEARAKITRKHDGGYDNAGLQVDECSSRDEIVDEQPKLRAAPTNLPPSDVSSARTSDSSLVRKIVREAQSAPSNRDSDSDLSAKYIYPNFAECIKETMRDAELAERDALEFIKKSQAADHNYETAAQPQQQHHTSPAALPPSTFADSRPQPTKKTPSPPLKSPQSPLAGDGRETPKHRVKAFFQRFLK